MDGGGDDPEHRPLRCPACMTLLHHRHPTAGCRLQQVFASGARILAGSHSDSAHKPTVRASLQKKLNLLKNI